MTTLRQDVEIINKLGLHARASAKFTQLAGTFQSEVWLERNGRRVNGKSIMGVMMLAAGKGTVVSIETTGDDLFIRNELGKPVRLNRDVYQIAASRLLEQLYGETK